MASDDERGTVVPLSRFRGSAGVPSASRRVDELISATDAAARVAALSVPELFFLIQNVGFADTQELIALATPEQLRGCVDIEVWDRDRFQIDAARPWLAALVDAGFEKVGQVWETLDAELAALVFQRWVNVYDTTLEEAPPEESERPLIKTPDTFFILEVTAEHDDDVRLVQQLVEDLYRADMALARHTLMSARSEPAAELEESSYRWRAGRMADLGYVDFYDALEVFRPLDPRRVEIGEGTADVLGDVAEGDEARVARNLPVEMADAVIRPSFLARALERVLDPAEAERLETAIVYLVNRVLSASRTSPGNEDAVRAGAEHTAATLSLGLETVAAGDLDRAADALRTVSLTRLHRVGFTVTMRLARLARALAPRAAVASDIDAALLSALLAARPWFPTLLDTPPVDGWRAFASVEDVRIGAAALTRLALRIAIAEQGLGVDLVHAAAEGEPRPVLDDYMRTALARALAGGELAAAPLSGDELARARARAADASARADARAAFERHLDQAGVVAGREYLPALVDSWLDGTLETLGSLPTDEPVDPRFVDGLILKTKG